MKKKKKKKWIVIIIVLILVLGVSGRGRGKAAPASSEPRPAATQETVDREPEQPAEQPSEPEVEEDAPAEESGDADSALISPEFKKTMDDYEAWFDHYCDVMEQYQENPSDLEVLSEMTDLLAEEEEMLNQMEEMDESEMNEAELAYYIDVTSRIEKRLLEVAY